MAATRHVNGTDFGRRPHRAVRNRSKATETVVAHLDGLPGQFDALTARSSPGRITPLDLVAVGMLGSPIPAPAAAWLLGSAGEGHTSDLLADITPDARLWDCDATEIIRAADLFHLVRAATSQIDSTSKKRAMGQQAATRLLAAKRPNLVPIDDRTMRRALHYPKDGNWWRRWRDAFDDDLISAARDIRARAALERPAAADLTELRVLDIAIRRGR